MEKNVQANWLDNFIGFWSPQSKLMRMRYKYANEVTRRKYEGASKGRRTAGWKTAGGSANAEIASSLHLLRNRTRDLTINNPYAARAIQGISSNVVGRGIDTSFLGGAVRQRERVNNLWRAWANTKACDWDGRHTFQGLQRLVSRTVADGGEAVVRLRRTQRMNVVGPDGVRRQVPPIQLQVLEGNHIDDTRRSGLLLETGNKIILGIEVDPDGKRAAYHLFEEHPGALNLVNLSRFRTFRIPADEVSHVYRMDRPSQIRGVPWGSPIVLRTRDLDEYEDAQLIRQKIAACFSVFIHDIEGLDSPLPDNTDGKNAIGEKVEPGIIEFLPNGKRISFANPPDVQNYKEYMGVNLHGIASGFGVSYELLTSDYSDVSFSSARMAHLEFGRNIKEWQWHMLIPEFMGSSTQWFLQAAQLVGERTDGLFPVYTPPPRDMVDPTKEIPAQRTAIRSGMKSLSEVARERGRTLEELLTELSNDLKLASKLGLVLDTDGSVVQSPGRSSRALEINPKPDKDGNDTD